MNCAICRLRENPTETSQLWNGSHGNRATNVRLAPIADISCRCDTPLLFRNGLAFVVQRWL